MGKETEFGSFIRELRDERRMSLRGAAKAIGIGHMRLDELERGVSRTTGRPTRPRRELLSRLAEVYEVPHDALLERAGYAREERALSQDEQLVVDLLRCLDDHHRRLAMQLVMAVERESRTKS